MDITPLFTRLKQKFHHFPASAGIYLPHVSDEAAGFVRIGDKRVVTATFSNQGEVLKLLRTSGAPHIVCVCVSEKERSSYEYLSLLRFLLDEDFSLITADLDATLKAFQLIKTDCEIEDWLTANGIEMSPHEFPVVIRAALAAIVGYFYLADEFEFIPEAQSVVPLLFENHPLFTLLRLVPYGEVTTFADVAKTLGLHWNERRIMGELSRLPEGAEVFGHRIVHRDGSLSELFPGGRNLQKEILKWELVPFVSGERVDLSKALWTKQKYRPLTNCLRHANPKDRFLELRFIEIEKIIEAVLPRAARRLGSWWNDDRPHAYLWQDAGCTVVSVNMKVQSITFDRKEKY